VQSIREGFSLKDKIKILLFIFTLSKYKPAVYIKNKDGFFFARKNSSDLWMLSTLGEEELRNYFKLSKGVFLDIGANVGKYSIILGKQLKENGKVYSFEPEPSNIEGLKKNILLNEVTNVKIFPLACSNKKGLISFYLNEKNSGAHSLIKKSKKEILINCDTLDNILKEQNLKEDINLIKIDVEGAEAEVLKGAINTLKKHHPKIIFEAWNEEYLENVKKVLKPFKYEIKKIAEENYFAY
jgi:FkbM family methyltransferase